MLYEYVYPEGSDRLADPAAPAWRRRLIKPGNLLLAGYTLLQCLLLILLAGLADRGPIKNCP
jgi:hypothetical protein